MRQILLAYLAGSVPFAFLLARRAGIDVRVAGSGNVGAANVLRTTGAWRGAAVMLLDVGKGALAVVLASLTNAGATVTALAAAAAVVGHIYPVWLRFHGGKGVAVAAGVFAVLTPRAASVAAALFLVIVVATRYVSLGSIGATIALPPAAWLAGEPGVVVAAAAATGVLILFRHRSNIRRLIAGTERRMGAAAGRRQGAGA
jgi:glycerol-3-phosphate acyltransferase PlsY